MGFKPMGFLHTLAIAAMGAVSFMMTGGGGGGGAALMAPGMEEVISGRGGGGRSYGTTRGGRAHRRWKTARASGRHNFRKTLARG